MTAAAKLLRWYRRHKRELPWRATSDPYRIWVSEIMLQQTRVAAVIPYYERFLARFPTVETLAAAPEDDVLTHWAGLGYYSRARNLQRAARQIVAQGGFPRTHAGLLALAGVGDYTAAAVASIAFGLPHAVLDGNVMRVMARFTADDGDIATATARTRLQQAADAMLDRQRPGEFNQAVMELGATLCLPRDPQCLLCPLQDGCAARQLGRQDELPVKSRKKREVRIAITLFLIQSGDTILLWRRSAGSARMEGFWELPDAEQIPSARPGRVLGRFQHMITFHHYSFEVVEASVGEIPPDLQWVPRNLLTDLPLSTVARKALECGGS